MSHHPNFIYKMLNSHHIQHFHDLKECVTDQYDCVTPIFYIVTRVTPYAKMLQPITCAITRFLKENH